MDETMNAVINNLGDRVGDMFEAVGPIVEGIGSISKTVVQETANAGFGYTMVGLTIIAFGVVCIFLWSMSMKMCMPAEGESEEVGKKKKEDLEGYLVVTILGAIFSFVIGLWVTLYNLGIWLAPTKEVIREVLKSI